MIHSLRIIRNQLNLSSKQKNYRYNFNKQSWNGYYYSTQSSINKKSSPYPISVYLKTIGIYGFSLSLILSPIIIDKLIGGAKDLLLSDEQIIDFEQSRLNAEIRIDYERAYRDSVLKPEESNTFLDLIVHHLYVFYRLTQLSLIFLPTFILTPIAICFESFRPIWWKIVKYSLGTAGGCWIKLGQWASTRPDLFPDEVINQLSDFQNRCPAHPFSATKKIIRDNYGADIDELFVDFDPNPIASGAIAQVYKAKLRQDGREVAIKVLHPHIKQQIIVDLNFMHTVAKIISLIPSVKWMSLDESLEQFSMTMANQVDMRHEARNLMRFGQNFSRDRYVVFPQVIENMTTSQVLVETFEHGMNLSTYMKSYKDPNEHKKLAKIGLLSFLKMILVQNFIHADLHPGNILVRKNSETNQLQIVLLDCGFITELSDTDWLNFKRLFKCIVTGDGKKGAHLMVEHARQTKISDKDRDKFAEEMDVLFREIRNKKMSEIEVGVFISQVLNVVRKYRVKIESNFATLIIATVILEGIGRQLDPEINILDESIPILAWSDKATVEDRIIFLREKVKDEFIKDKQNTTFMDKMRNLFRPIVLSFKR